MIPRIVCLTGSNSEGASVPSTGPPPFRRTCLAGKRPAGALSYPPALQRKNVCSLAIVLGPLEGKGSLLSPAAVGLLGDAHLADRIHLRHSLTDKYLNSPRHRGFRRADGTTVPSTVISSSGFGRLLAVIFLAALLNITEDQDKRERPEV